MPQPTPYTRGFSFTDFQAANPSAPIPAPHVDAELDGISHTLTGVLGNLLLIQRDDGKLADGCVTLDAISMELLAAITPRDGVDGTDGTDGTDGLNAVNPNIAVEVTTLAPGAAATVNVTGVYPNLTIHLGIPKGDAAPAGAATLADATYGDIVVSGGGTNFQVSKVLGGQTPSVVGHTHIIANVTGLQAALDGKEPSLAVGTALQYYRGDKTWQTLNAAAVGLGNVNNTSDANKPVSTAQQAALDGKSNVGHTHAMADVIGLTAALAAKATTAQVAAKADAITLVQDFNVDQAVSDATHNGAYNRMTGATGRTITFGTLSAGHAAIWVNRGSVNMTIACAGGYFKNGGASATANLTLAPGGKLTAFHEGAGVWTFDGTGF